MQKLFSLYNLVIYSGIAAFLLMGVTGIMGMQGVDIDLHTNVAIAAFVFACIHAGLIVYQKLKIKAARKRMQAAAHR